MKILYLASEVAPFSKTGGLADVAGALPAALARAGCRVIVATPLYRSIDRARFGLERKSESVSVPLAGRVREARVHSLQTSERVTVFFIEQDALFGRDGLYDDRGDPYADNAERFGFFTRAGLELCRLLDSPPDIVHANDWQTALAPFWLKHDLAGDPLFAGARSVFTVHNLAYQGLAPRAALAALGIDEAEFSFDRLEFYGQLSLIKAGLLDADQLTTVSPGHAKEIVTREYGEGLDGLLRARAADLTGILNGADYNLWNPRYDPHLAAAYGPGDRAGKLGCRADLVSRFGLTAGETTPIAGMISRLTEQKGVDLLIASLDGLLEQGLCLAVLGTGAPYYEEQLAELAGKHPGRVGLELAYDEALAHRVLGGADLLLMPSRYEPCGLNQLHAMKYGTLPVVRATGGLHDTVIDVDADAARGNGFKFEAYQPAALLDAVRRAVARMGRAEDWCALVERAMEEDFSWDGPAVRYVELYRRLRARERSLSA